MEIWKDYPENPSYLVSSLGRVLNKETGKFLRGTVRTDGYTQLKLGRRGSSWLLHCLVLHVFVGPRPLGLMGLHRDDVRSNNVLSNLRWGTSKTNAEDRVKNNRARGRDAAAAKLTREQVLEICRRIDADDRFENIANDFRTTVGAVTHINRGTVWAWLTGRSSANARCPTHKNHARKLTKERVTEIARRGLAGENQHALATEFGVRNQTINDIVLGKIWNHTTGIERIRT